jgi:hypothetical protein
MEQHRRPDERDAQVKENDMNLIERYAAEVGKHLPRKMRADIETEIRSTLEDMLEERSQQAGRPADDEMVKELLKEYGAPDKVAATYLPERYLIGPKLFPIFTLVLKIVFSVLTVLALVGFGIRFGMGETTLLAFGTLLGKSMLEYLGGMMSAFGNIVFVFAILQWALPASEFEDEAKGKEWDPAMLTQDPEPDEVKMWEPIWAIVFIALALFIFNFYPQILTFTPSLNNLGSGTVVIFPIFAEVFFTRYLPWMNILWVLEIVLNLLLLRQGRWTTATRWFNLTLKAGGIALAVAILTGPFIFSFGAETLAASQIPAEAAAILMNMFQIAVKMALIIAVVAGTAEIFKELYKMYFKPGRAVALPVKG